MTLELPSTRSWLRFSLALVMVFMVISSPVFMFVNPSQASATATINESNSNRIDSSGYHSTPSIPAAATASPFTSATPMIPATTNIENNGNFSAQAALQKAISLQSNNIVNSPATYEIIFTTATTGDIKTIEMVFPAGTDISFAGYIENGLLDGILPGSFVKSGTTITYTIHSSPVMIPAGSPIRLEVVFVKNPPNPSSLYQVTITTKDSDGNVIDGPTQTAVYTIKQIGTGDIANGAVSSAKIAASFAYERTLADGENGWVPDGLSTFFDIQDPLIGTQKIIVNLDTPGGGGPVCNVVNVVATLLFEIGCTGPPPNGTVLRYAAIAPLEP